MIANEEFFVVRKELREFSVIHKEVVLIMTLSRFSCILNPFLTLSSSLNTIYLILRLSNHCFLFHFWREAGGDIPVARHQLCPRQAQSPTHRWGIFLVIIHAKTTIAITKHFCGHFARTIRKSFKIQSCTYLEPWWILLDSLKIEHLLT